MKDDNKPVIVYRSKGEKVMDEFMWENGGTVAIAGSLLFAVCVLILALYAIATRRK